ncbi:molybdopterin-dependent oxidoreductase [Maricaulis parjimensis]|uniref:molybdopterin-dependent oxidoreductase n=1 Tax=Maricaulis parjimensis TaxID=144023 RepID=UPI00193A38BF|nr:molybdopterin-dependent oxidoreductase [Maricaulis parjimensis]
MDFRFLITIVLGCACLAGCGARDAAPFDGPLDAGADVVTLFGDVRLADRGAVDAETEPLFTNFGMQFEAAMGLSRESLLALPQHEVQVDYPAGAAFHGFSGPLLRDVLALAGSGEGDVIVTALDGYQRTIERSRVETHDVILAVSMDDNGLPLGGFGPAMLVWPRAQDPALQGMPDDDWVWGVFAIEIVGAD